MRTKLTSTKVILFLILLLGGIFRIYGINWDQGYHLHPDERAIILAVVDMRLPDNISAFFSADSSWNPKFFAYGSLPFYLLRITGNFMSLFNELFGRYDGIHIVGRILSSIFDLGTIYLLFRIGKRFYSQTVGLLASFFYAISVLPIQLAHFYAVDTILTFFIVATLYFLLSFSQKPSVRLALFIGLCFGAAIATKISALVLLSAIGFALAVDFLILFFKHPHKIHLWAPQLSLFVRKLFRYGYIIFLTTIVTFLFFEPYALLDFANFWRQTTEQSHMTQDPFTFPYTLQYVGKTPYLFELKNVFFYGLGPLLGFMSFSAVIYTVAKLFRNESHRSTTLILFSFFIMYFLVVGRFSIGFMRYMLPLYPFFAIFLAIFAYDVGSFVKRRYTLPIVMQYSVLIVLYVLLLVWPLSFAAIYRQPNTRVLATDWIHAQIPINSTIAIEHWDDSLPLYFQERYTMATLPLYDPDTPEKWDALNSTLAETDYIIIASNRLYSPLQKLTDCATLPPYRCYPHTALYYKALFSGLNVVSTHSTMRFSDVVRFRKVAEFSSYPALPFVDISLNDIDADESFTVYDHPKIMIFKKI